MTGPILSFSQTGRLEYYHNQYKIIKTTDKNIAMYMGVLTRIYIKLWPSGYSFPMLYVASGKTKLSFGCYLEFG